jgi:ATP-dependent DNA helicase HFM1/MER3
VHFKLTFEDDSDEDDDTDLCIETKATVGATMSHIDNTGKKKEQQLPHTTSKLESSMIFGPNREPCSQPLGFAVDLDRELGGKFRNLWPYRILNEVQSAFWPVCFNTDHNVVIAAPTGVGKTMALEAAICRLLQEDEGTGNGRKTWKAVYVAPVKALCQQRLVDWQRRFGTRFGLKCAELTGDSAGMREVAASQIILTTPEKFDAVSRDWRDNLYLLGSVRLVLIDEAHFLGEDPRGSALEALICRLKIMKSHKVIMDKGLPASKLRILAASATLPNVEDIGRWLEAPPEAIFNFDYTYRPVPLEIHVLGYANASNPFLFQRTLEGRAPEVIGRYSEGKATLVFCGSKKGAEALATKLAGAGSGFGFGNKQVGRGGMQGRSQQRLEAERFSNIQNHKLKDLLLTSDGAVAFHHAGLTAEDRTCVETLFQQGVVRTLCSTSTLAQGINSPAFLAIILGTTFWRGTGTGYEDLPVSAVLQMIGRAGRPGYDDRGVAVIMTSKDKDLMYMSMAEGQEVVESQLPARFHESLNAEVCSNVISDLGDAIRWLRSTFLWVRTHRNPDYYTALLPRGTVCRDADNSIGEYLKAYMLRILAELEAENVLRLEKTVGLSRDGAPIENQETETIVPLVAGRVMSKTLVSFETIKILRAVPSDASLEDLLYACCGCPEVCNPVRKAEKRPLNDLLKRVRFSKGLGIKKCTHPSHKAFVLVQACLGNLEIVDFTLKVCDNPMCLISSVCAEE